MMMYPFHNLLQRTILALVLFQLAFSHSPVHARHGVHLYARHPQFWDWFPSWFSRRDDQRNPPPSPPAQPAPQAPTPPAASPPAPPGPAGPAPPASPAPPATQAPASSSAPSNTSSASSQPSLSSPANQTTAGCKTIRVRREWRKFSVKEKTDYINAVKCLADLPSKVLPGGEYRRYDDFENVHSRMRHKIHWMAIFLPWHRHFMYTYETALKQECGYSGNLPRWDWTLDSDDMSKSPVWSPDPIIGFGTNVKRVASDPDEDGLDGTTVRDGAFANWPLYYPEYHSLQRNYNLPSQYKQVGRSYGSQYFDAAAVRRVDSQTTYAKFEVALEGTDPASTGPSLPGPHSIIHVIIGGDISPSSYAANESLLPTLMIMLSRFMLSRLARFTITDVILYSRVFYLHHAQVDYLWARWQNAQPNRKMDYGGPITRGSTRNEAKLTDRLQFLGITPDTVVKNTMDTTAAPYCYRYE